MSGRNKKILNKRENILLQKLTVPQLVKKFPVFYGTQSSLPHLPACWQFLSPTKKETSYSDQTLTFASHSKKFSNLSIQPGLRGSNDLCVGRKVATLQLFFQSGRAKDLSAPLYKSTPTTCLPVQSRINPVHASHPTSWISILILSSHLRVGLPSGLFPSGFPITALYAALLEGKDILFYFILFYFILFY